MSFENSRILFWGNAGRGRAIEAIIEAQGGAVYRPQSVVEALGMYMSFAPDIVVIDRTYTPEDAAELAAHFESVHARLMGLDARNWLDVREVISDIETAMQQDMLPAW